MSRLTHMSSKAVEAKQWDVLQEASSYLEAVGRFRSRCPADSVPAVMDEVPWVIHAPRSLGGASGGGFGRQPRLTSCEPFTASSSQRVLPSAMALGALLGSLSAC